MANLDEGQRSLQDLFASLRTSSAGAHASQPSEARPGQPPSSATAPSNDPSSRFLNYTSQQQPSATVMSPSHNTNPAASIAHALAHPPSSRGGTPKLGPQHGQQPSHDASSSGADRATNLLNLLRQGGGQPKPSREQPSAQPAPAAPVGASSGFNFTGLQSTPSPAPHVHGRGVSASDLVASFMGRPSAPDTPRDATPPPQPEARPTSANPQDYLLQLLNQSQPSSFQRRNRTSAMSGAAESPAAAGSSDENGVSGKENNSHRVPDVAAVGSGKQEAPVRVFGSASSREPTPFDPKDMPTIQSAKTGKDTSATASPITAGQPNPFESTASLPIRTAGNSNSRSGRDPPSRQSSHLSEVSGAPGRTLKPHRPSRHDSGTNRATPKEELTTGGQEVLQSIESPAPIAPGDGRSKVEALMGIGAPTENPETVNQALNDVGDKVSQQLEDALAQGESEARDAAIEEQVDEQVQEQEIKEQLQEAAVEAKRDIDAEGGEEALKEAMPGHLAHAITEVLDEAAAGNVEGSADDEDSFGKGEDDFVVPVYNFPMKPFVSIDLKQEEAPTLPFRQSIITDIARLKKDFDQIDRTLATASNDYIVYAMPKPGGYRVIRQDDGYDRQIFKEHRDPVFNVAISTAPRNAPSHDVEGCIGTGVSGTVYWTALRLYGDDCVEAHSVARHCVSFPPVPVPEEQTSSGQLKTRAKKSSRHPEFFAIGRGKSIQIVYPLHAQQSEYIDSDRVVATTRYFRNRKLKINTGKAGKDFTFSEDDTVVATLDKAGRLRLWDVRDLTEERNNEHEPIPGTEIDTPIVTYSTVLPTEKSWPTSVLFVDKTRAYTKGSALRYIIVGMKQNHTLQLWDLGLGKAVQELNFPHSQESDAICSVAYHAPTGIVVVGHPTRNSIYLIHLSAPKYNLQKYSQAKYVQKLASKDSSLPKPDSTAILSGMREYSFASKGQLRSVDILPVTPETVSSKEDPGLFELYVMHSKGVTCLNIHKTDLGWGEDSKVLDAHSAEESGLIAIKELRETLPAAISEHSSVNGDGFPLSAAKSGPSKVNVKRANNEGTRGDSIIESAEPYSLPNGSQVHERTEKRKKKKSNVTGEGMMASAVPPPAPVPPNSQTLPSRTITSPSSGKDHKSSAKKVLDPSNAMSDSKPSNSHAVGGSGSLGTASDLTDKQLKKVEAAVSAEFSKVLGRELEEIYRRFNDDKRAQDAMNDARHEAVLHMISDALNENVEKALSRIIHTNITQSVVPTIHNVTTTTLRKEVPDWLSKHLLATLPAQLRLALPEAVSKAMQTQDVLKFMSEQITQKFSAAIERALLAKLQADVLPMFQKLTLDSVQKQIKDAEQRTQEQIRGASPQKSGDAAKIDQLTTMVRSLTETVQSMATQQAGLQTEIQKLQKSGARGRETDSSGDDDEAPHERVAKEFATEITPEQQEINHLAELLTNGQFEQAMIEVNAHLSVGASHTD